MKHPVDPLCCMLSTFQVHSFPFSCALLVLTISKKLSTKIEFLGLNNFFCSGHNLSMKLSLHPIAVPHSYGRTAKLHMYMFICFKLHQSIFSGRARPQDPLSKSTKSLRQTLLAFIHGTIALQFHHILLWPYQQNSQFTQKEATFYHNTTTKTLVLLLPK